ncbi:putative amino acid permease [Microthyrium microscopicum]|uniref:Putative amino acid permease n=1 Tax=Microthyrium microscopicum TaxID=703497 RepID=A0A6A6UIU2_9PEZI|nr:putative amino acid permease [Microthyrium microscopicum]
MYDNYDDGAPKQTFVQRFVDSFKPEPSSRPARVENTQTGAKVYDVEAAVAATSQSPLARKLKGRHLQMIAIGGSIGTGLFVGSGQALANGGPASLVIAFTIVGIMLFCTVQALGELATLYPVAGSFSAYSTRFLCPSWGYAMGWNYALQWLVVLPLEIVAATLTIEFWNHGSINNDAWVAIFLVLILTINLFGVKGYGEAEFVFSIIKVVAVVGFIILGVILDIGGGPGGAYIGGKYWRNPGAFNNGFKGLCSTFVTAAFAFAGTELVGLAAAETLNPRKSLPRATKQVFWRITLFYIISLTLVGLLVPYTDPRLLNGDNDADAKASPFVIAIQNAGIKGLPSVMNGVIMIAVLSVGNSSIYGSSRTLAALAEQKQAPRILGYIDRKGRPLVGILLASLLGFLAFLAGSSKQTDVFRWMIAVSGLSSVFTWGSICLAHIRFRKAWLLQGHTLSELAFRSQCGVYGSWVGLILNILVLIAQFWTGFAPVGWEQMTAAARTSNWFQDYLALPIVLAFYIPHKLYFRTKVVRTHNMDLHSGIRELNLTELLAEEERERQSWPRWKRIWHMFC